MTMRIWGGSLPIAEGAKHACYGPGEEEDIEACRSLAARLGIREMGWVLKELIRDYGKEQKKKKDRGE